MTPLEPSDPRRIATFDLRGRLGVGVLGVVYAALAPDQKWIAVTLAHAELGRDQGFRERFTREVRAMSRIRARCVAPVLAYDTSGERPWFATAFLPGPTLDARLRTQGPLPEAGARLLAAGTAEAIAAVHATGAALRNLTPTDVILTPDGPKVLDAGITRAPDGAGASGTGGMPGSPGERGPEHPRDRNGPEADVFAWGVLVVHAVTGRPPFGTGPAGEPAAGPPQDGPDLRDVPESLRGVVARALAEDPAARPTAEELVGLLAGEGTVPRTAEERAALVDALIARDRTA
ncbi:serine/threonine-protein kinase, partial [Nocardiopsis sp. MG754419]|uniref:serine/threonine-protein kinase n=1 Tax=Nocardiopsis sp. MG754419 TaxID=2259865 RepID=UPI001BA7C8A5